MYKLYQNSLKEYKAGAMGYCAIAVIFQSGLGSVAIMLILMAGSTLFEVVQLSLVTIGCMLYNAAVLSQQKAKLAFNVLLTSVILSSVVIVFQIIV